MSRLTLCTLFLLGLGGCAARDAEFADYRFVAMATTIELRLPIGTTDAYPDLLGEIETELQAFGRDYYAWGDGELHRLNLALSASGSFDASPAMAALLGRARDIAVATDGAFDPGVGGLVELWGFNDAGNPPGRAPTDSAIAAGLKVGGSIENIDIAGNRLSASVAEYTLDLGGIAKGAAVDRVVARLEALGIAPALVNAGGDLRVLGKPEGRQWRIGIKAPRADGLLGSVTLSAGEAAFSSGDYERYFEQDGVRLHHILDPRTGRPAIHTQAVTVVAQDGTMADAAATALFVAGPDEWRAMAERLGIELALRVDADGTVSMTPQMRDRFQTAAGDRSDIIAASD